MKWRFSDQAGFTLPELLVVIGIVAALLVASLFTTRQKTLQPEIRNAERQLHVAQILQILNRYVTDNGSLPENLGSKAALIGSEEDAVDLCAVLVPKYVKDLPLDPIIGAKLYGDEPCTAADNTYNTGYAISWRAVDGLVTVSAPITDDQVPISVSRKF